MASKPPPKRFEKQTQEDRDLTKLYKDRVNDRNKYKSKRQKSLEAPLPDFGALLTSFFKKDSEALRKIEESRALMAWEVFVGDAAARVSKPLRIRGTQLIVRVQDGLWMQQLMMLKHDLLRKYREAFPKLKLTDIFFTRQQV